jgi:hypothetical protein
VTKKIHILLLSLCSTIVFGQAIDFNQLNGTWYCYKATQGTTDMTDMYKDHYATFKADFKYIEERRYYYNTYSGIYKLDKTSKQISFKNMVSVTKFPKAKVPMKDQIDKYGKESEFIFSLDKDNLVILLKKGGELQGDTKLFYRRDK